MSDTFEKSYGELEERFCGQVKMDRKTFDCDDIVFLPLFLKPTQKVDYIFVSMEPSLTSLWANPPNRRTGENQVKKGFRNFAPYRFEDTIIHYCAQTYLPAACQNYYITDMSKGAMLPGEANDKRRKMWIDWFPLLQQELELVANDDATLFTIGKCVHGFLQCKKPIETSAGRILVREWIREKFHCNLICLLHHSPNNRGNWGKFINDNCLNSDFAKYKLEKNDLVEFVDKILTETHTSEELAKHCKDNLRKIPFNESLKKLAFAYKYEFEKCRGKRLTY
jgi:hypothetical protein